MWIIYNFIVQIHYCKKILMKLNIIERDHHWSNILEIDIYEVYNIINEKQGYE